MIFRFEERPSDSSFVERVWRTHSERAGAFTSLATSHWEMVVMRHNGKRTLTVRGPETQATPVYCSVQAEWFGIIISRAQIAKGTTSKAARPGPQGRGRPQPRAETDHTSGHT